ncbi:hypothetical protein T4B_14296 [Trichinella pseudospiralis]|uniref:Uncharacterized protein n=1 Tax=Trichinella pseudospiralis TaxID=6337 RepID=A0A0V1GLU7_TRIPS|nr:hypothetical protein T4B_14296 [Trichinella pseudospiralis]KRZ28282.1 hypothetical protein T4C_1393 [Trichinella pseudospiralis]
MAIRVAAECVLYNLKYDGLHNNKNKWNRLKHEWFWSHVPRLRISRDIAEITYGSENMVMMNRKEIKYAT